MTNVAPTPALSPPPPSPEVAGAVPPAVLSWMLEGSGDAIQVTDGDGIVTAWNAAATALYGWEADELVGRSWLERLPPAVRDEFALTLASGRSTVAEERRDYHKNGSVLWVETRVAPIVDASGAPGGRVWAARDRSHTKQLERELESSRTQLRQFLNSGPLIAFVKDGEGRYLYANDRFSTISRLPAEQVVGRRDEDLFPPEVAESFRAHDRRAIVEQRVIEFTELAPRGDELRESLVYKFPLQSVEGEQCVGGLAIDITERKRSETALRTVQERLAEAQRIAGIGSWWWEPATGLVWWSDETYRLFGCEPGEFEPSYDEFLVRVHPDDRSQVSVRLQALLAGGGSIDHEIRIVRKDGTTIWVHSRGHLTRDAGGAMVRLEGTDQDITQRKLSEVAVRNNHAFKEALIRSAAEGIAVFAPIPQPPFLRFTVWNDRMIALTGYTSDEANRVGWFDAIFPDVQQRERALRRIERAYAGEELRSEEWSLVRKDGQRRILSISTSVIVGEQGEQAIVAMISDVTERRRIEAALRESETRYRTFVDHATDALFLHVAGGRILDVNRQACEALGYSREELIGQMPAMFDVEMTSAKMEAIGRRLQAGEVVTFTSRHRRYDGATFPVEVRIRNFVLEDGRYSLSLVRDITQQQLAHDQLRASEKRLRELADAIPQIVWTALPDGALDHLNARAMEYSGTEEHNLTGWSWARMIHPDDLQRVLETWEQVLRTGVGQDIEFRIRRFDGQYHWHFTRQVASHNADGTIDRWYGTCTDITDRKLAEEALAQSESRLRSIIQSEPECVKIVGRNGEVREMNPAGLRMVEADRLESIVGRPAVELVAPPYRTAYREFHERICGGESAGLEFEIIGLRGTRRHVESQAVPWTDPDGVVVQLSVTRDVTARRQAERMIAWQKRVLETIAAGAALPDVLREVLELVEEQLPDWNGAILLLNRDGTRLDTAAGGNLEPEFLQTLHDLPVGPESCVCGATAYSGVASVVNDADVLPGAASPAPFWDYGRRTCWCVPVFASSRSTDADASRRILGTFALYHREPTSPSPFASEIVVGAARLAAIAIEREIAARALHDSAEQLRQSQKMEAIGQLAGGMAHDFNNLLTVISGYSELLLEKLSLDDARRSDAIAIRDAGVRAAGLTRQLLAFSRRQRLEPVLLDLNELVRRVEAMLRRLIREDVEVNVQLAPRLPLIKADPVQLDQVLLNLIVNARDAMPHGGRLTIETSSVVVRGGLSTNRGVGSGAENYVRLCLTDTGCGMTEEVRSRIFEPFFTTKSVGAGTGLGLAVVHGVVSQSGGQIRVQSAVGLGTSFEILLPAVSAESQPLPSELPPSLPIQTAATILLVEDEEPVRCITSHVLQLHGYTVLEAEHGLAAIETARRHGGPIHLLLTDIVMPHLGGGPLAELLKSEYPALQVLYMSGYPDDELVLGDDAGDGLRLLQKPFPPSLLVDRVQTILGAASSSDH